MSRHWRFLLNSIPLAFLIGCSSNPPPDDEMRRAEKSVEWAREAESEKYFGSAFKALQDTLQSAYDAKLGQDSAGSFSRDYARSRALFIRVDSIAKRLAADAWKLRLTKSTRVPIFLLDDGRQNYKSKNGSHFIMQTFGLDTAKKMAARIGGGIILTMEGIPVPLTLYGFSSFFSSSMCALYENTILELNPPKDIDVGLLLSVDGDKLSLIRLKSGNSGKLYISDDYRVYPDSVRATESDGPFATINYGFKPSSAGQLVIKRNGEVVSSSRIDTLKNYSVDLRKVKSQGDLVEWYIESEGKVVRKGVIGFPVAGAIPQTVVYNVILNND